MPSTDADDWPANYARYKARAATAANEGWYSNRPRLGLFLTNQIALRGYMDKTTEPGMYDYFRADWIPGNESLNKSYQDYMLYLMNRHIREGGVTHYYFDISFTKDTADLIAGFGYRLPDGRVQPTAWTVHCASGISAPGRSYRRTICIPAASPGMRRTPSACAHCRGRMPSWIRNTHEGPDHRVFLGAHDRHVLPGGLRGDHLHLGFMNPNWATMHDANMGGGDDPFNTPGFRHFGIAGDDVQFVPYWRNGGIVKHIGQGLLASIWKRPGKAILEVMIMA